MAHSNQRLAINLDEIERHAKQAQSQQAHDPLAELARIVGQDDPFRSVSANAGQQTVAAHGPEGADAGWENGSRAPERSGSTYAGADYPHYATRDSAHGSPDHQDDHDYPHYHLDAFEPRRSRKGLIAVGAVLGSAALGVFVALTFKGAQVLAPGEPPIVQASREPLKVQPENPGGVDIPNQDAQVYERGAKESQTRVVNREEQPIDVQQAMRSAPSTNGARASASAPLPSIALAPSTSTPSASATPNGAVPQNGLASGLGEPRRVRTVAVRPDGTIAPPETYAPPAIAGPAVTPSGPPNAAATPTTPQMAPVPPQRPRSMTLPATAPRANTPAPAETAAEDAQAAPGGSRQARRTAAAPQTTVSGEAPETTSAAPGYAVQVTVQNSEQEARKQFEALQRKFAGDLGRRSPSIQRAEVNGKVVYRVRVGPLAREDANSLCTRLKSGGGSCFVARN